MPDDRRRRFARDRFAALLIAVLAGVAVFAIASLVFPYHSSNHDEGVYLQQAALLLDGHLQLSAGELADAFRPWFFVEDGGRLYPKYTPVPAAMYAVSMALVGEPRVTLALVASGNTVLVYALGSIAFDRRIGLVAAAVFAASPLALLTGSVFLPYAPTTLLNLTFAVSYLRAIREDSLPWAAAAGLAIGLAFFARPFTAVLFAIPFVAHAGWTCWRAVHTSSLWPIPTTVTRNVLVATGGLAFVVLALAYNAHLTGSPLVFPYEAFAPIDGPGFGRRRILHHAIDYTPGLALRANGYVLWYFATRWFTAGLLGTGCAVVGVAIAVRRWRRSAGTRTPGFLLSGLFVTIPLGNLAFWGNFNILATMSDPTDGLLAGFGPFYHFDLLAPLSIFAAVAVVAGWRRLRHALRARTTPRTAWSVAIGVLVASVLVVGALNAAVVGAPLDRNVAHTEQYERAYAPFEEHNLENALVFLPTPYGDWLNHPFQYLRNDGGLDGDVVYVLDGDPERDFAVLDASPDRTYYRYTYRGEWAPSLERGVTPTLQPLSVVDGRALSGETHVGVPDRIERATVRLEGDAGDHVDYVVDDPGETISVEWTVAEHEARLRSTGASAGSVRIEETDELVLTVTLLESDGSTFTYRQTTTVRTTGEHVEVIWPPERTGCPLVTRCGTEGTYLPDGPGAQPDWFVFDTEIDITD